ncbi:MAG: hypothetical protein GXY83_40310 [Rhodopirellula sp.]|nr:hypothetical protein [Rhodopirellula sp.]
MTTEEWSIVVGVAMSASLALGPWMFMVHAKLAVIAGQIVTLVEKIEKLTESHDRRLMMCIEHQAKLETHEVQLRHVEQRLRELA